MPRSASESISGIIQDFHTQLDGLNHFLADIHREEISLPVLIESLGFDQAQAALLINNQLQPIADHFILVIREKLSLDNKYLYFDLLVRKYGFNGEAPESIELISRTMELDLSYAGYSAKEALQKCSTKTAVQDFLQRIKADCAGPTRIIDCAARKSKQHCQIEPLG